MRKAVTVGVLLVIAWGAGYVAGRGTSAAASVGTGGDAMPRVERGSDLGVRSPNLQACIDRLRAARPRDLEVCWNELRDLGDPSGETRRLDEIIALDPLGAIALSKAAGETRVLEAIMERWAHLDPLAAFRASGQLPEFHDFFNLSGALANAALEDAIQRGDTAMLVEVLATAVTFHQGHSFRNRYGQSEPSLDQRREMLGALEAVDSFHPHFIGMFAGFAGEDYEAAQAWLEARPELKVGRPGLERSLIHAQFGHDFDAALERMTEFVERYPPGMRAGEGLAGRVAANDPLNAIPLLEKLVAHCSAGLERAFVDTYLRTSAEDQREEVRAELERRGLIPEPSPPRWPAANVDALREVLAKPDGVRSMRVEYHLRPTFGVELVAEAIAEADPSHVTQKAVEVTAWQWGAVDPEAALEWASELDDSFALPAARSALRNWATSDLEQAERYALDLPESAFRAAAAEVIVNQREGLDRAAALEWIGSQPAGTFRDAAAAFIVRRSWGSELNADELLPVAAGIDDEALRREALLRLLDEGKDIVEAPGIEAADRVFLREAKL